MSEKKVIVVINEQHKLLPVQEELLKEHFSSWEMYHVPSQGLTTNEQQRLISQWYNKVSDIVFISPIPYLLARLSYYAGADEYDIAPNVWLFLNNKREKKEVDGKIVYTVPQNGWFLVCM